MNSPVQAPPYKALCCHRDCPNRSPYCHNAETCEIWAEHERQKEASYAAREIISRNNPYRGYNSENNRKWSK